MAKRPTGKKRNKRQKVKARYAKAREDAQAAGVIETSPEGAVRNEVVDPSTQGSQPLPGLIGQAVRCGWATPEHMKIQQVDELHKIATDDEVEPHVRVAAIRTAQQADKDQWERENPDLAGKTRGGVNVGVEVNNNQVGILSQEALITMLTDEVHPNEQRIKDLQEQAENQNATGQGQTD